MNSYVVVIVYTKDNQKRGTFVGAHTNIVISETAGTARSTVQQNWDGWYNFNVTILDVQVRKIGGDMIEAMYNSYRGYGG